MYTKLKSFSELPPELATWLTTVKNQDQTLVLVTGVFDLLHEEHQIFLDKAKATGDVLLVGIESDLRVRKLKGEGRPVQNEQQRAEIVSRQPSVDHVMILPEIFDKPEHYRTFLTAIKPSFLAVSSHTPHRESKQALMAEVGGELKVVHEHNPAVSTTLKLQQQ